MAVQLGQVIDHLRLNAGQDEHVHPGNRDRPGWCGQRAVAQNMRQGPPGEDVLELARSLIQSDQRLPVAGRQRLQEYLAEPLAAVIGVLETVDPRRLA